MIRNGVRVSRVSLILRCLEPPESALLQLAMYLIPPLFGFLVGLLSRGRIEALRSLKFRASPLLWSAALLQVINDRFAGVDVGIPVLPVVFCMVFAWLALNMNSWPRVVRGAAVVLFVGVAANALALLVNGKMPYSPVAARAAGLSEVVQTVKNEPAHDGSKLMFLGDIIPLPPLRAVISLGDVLIAFGVAGFVIAGMHSGSSSLPASKNSSVGGGEL
jgi:hypothetical protein